MARARPARALHLSASAGAGLSACVEGMLSSAAPYFAVMDADLQHDEAVLPAMLRGSGDDKLDIVVGSRYIGGERTAGL